MLVFDTLLMLFVTKSLNSTIESSGVFIGEDRLIYDFPGFRHWYAAQSDCNITQGGALSPSLSNSCHDDVYDVAFHGHMCLQMDAFELQSKCINTALPALLAGGDVFSAVKIEMLNAPFFPQNFWLPAYVTYQSSWTITFKLGRPWSWNLTENYDLTRRLSFTIVIPKVRDVSVCECREMAHEAKRVNECKRICAQYAETNCFKNQMKRRQGWFRAGLWSTADVNCTHLIKQSMTATLRKSMVLPENYPELDPTNSKYSSSNYPRLRIELASVLALITQF